MSTITCKDSDFLVFKEPDDQIMEYGEEKYVWHFDSPQHMKDVRRYETIIKMLLNRLEHAHYERGKLSTSFVRAETKKTLSDVVYPKDCLTGD